MDNQPIILDADGNLAEYIERAASNGERFTLIQGGRPVAEIRPISKTRRFRELPALLASLPELSPSDSEMLNRDLASYRDELSHADVPDRWTS